MAFTVREVTTPEAWEACKRIREKVFIEEQACPPEEEWDIYDVSAHHVLGYEDDIPVATARWRVVDYKGRPVAKLERFAVLPAYRGKGYGRKMVEETMRRAYQAGYDAFLLHAQQYLESFYHSLGFRTVSDVFMEAGIPHIKMYQEGWKPPPA